MTVNLDNLSLHFKLLKADGTDIGEGEYKLTYEKSESNPEMKIFYVNVQFGNLPPQKMLVAAKTEYIALEILESIAVHVKDFDAAQLNQMALRRECFRPSMREWGSNGDRVQVYKDPHRLATFDNSYFERLGDAFFISPQTVTDLKDYARMFELFERGVREGDVAIHLVEVQGVNVQSETDQRGVQVTSVDDLPEEG